MGHDCLKTVIDTFKGPILIGKIMIDHQIWEYNFFRQILLLIYMFPRLEKTRYAKVCYHFCFATGIAHIMLKKYTAPPKLHHDTNPRVFWKSGFFERHMRVKINGWKYGMPKPLAMGQTNTHTPGSASEHIFSSTAALCELCLVHHKHFAD